MARHCALIAGVTGAVGRAVGKYLAAHEDWDVIGLARRVPPGPLGYPVIAVDLTDAGACRTELVALTRVTHVLYCARATHTAAVVQAWTLHVYGNVARTLEIFSAAAAPMR